MNTFIHVPPGFRFHPTDEELVDYYLRKKITSRRTDLDVIKDVDLYKIEPWDLQELCRIGTEEQNEWYFFSHKDKKYPTGTRTNRATTAGFWKATGRDKAIYSKYDLIGMRKTLVFYKGRAPNGQKSDWIMHEYRLETEENGSTPQEEGWVVCRVFKKKIPAMPRVCEHEQSSCWYDDSISFTQDLDSPNQRSQSHSPMPNYHHNLHQYSFKKEQYVPRDHFLQLPQLETTPKLLHPPLASITSNPKPSYALDITPLQAPSVLSQEHFHQLQHKAYYATNKSTAIEQVSVEQVTSSTDWRVLDKFVASQLSEEDVPKQHNSYSSNAAFHSAEGEQKANNALVQVDLDQQEMLPAEMNASASTSSYIDLWK